MFRERTVKIAAYTIVTFGALIVIFPFFWVFLTALKTPAEINVWPPHLFPKKPTLENFIHIILEENFLRYTWNSMVVSLGSMGSVLLTSSLAGFIFAKYNFRLKRFLFTLILTTAIIPLQAYMIPVFIMVFRAKMMNTYQGLIFPLMIMSFGVFFMRQTMMAIPDELLESARLDGANEFWMWLHVILPLSKSAMMALGIFAFTEAWAKFIWQLLVITRKSMYTTELGLAVYQRKFFIEYGPVCAGAVVTIAPMLILFLLLRKRIVKGVILTGMKT